MHVPSDVSLTCLNDTSWLKFESRHLSHPEFSRNTALAAAPGGFKKCVHYPRDAETGGASRDRTGDPLLAKQVLSQLSYGPIGVVRSAAARMVGLGGLEPPASPLSGVRSNHLSYRPGKLSWDAT